MNVSHRRFALPNGPSHWLHVVSGGLLAGPTMVCLHGATGNWSNYRPLMGYFAHDYRIEAPEMRGHGRTPWPGPWSLEQFYQDMESFLQTLPKPILLLAHSFGGYFGLRLTAEHPDWISHLVLLNTGSHIPRGLPFQFLRLTTPLCSLVKRPEGAIATDSEVTRHLMDHVLPDWDCQPFYSRLQRPVLTIAGRLDPLIPVGLVRASAQNIARQQTRILPWGMHVAMWERPALLNDWIRQFISAYPPVEPSLPVSAATS